MWILEAARSLSSRRATAGAAPLSGSLDVSSFETAPIDGQKPETSA